MCFCSENGACMVAEGGHAWLPGACVVARGACMVARGGMCGFRGVCMVAGGHVWLPGGHVWLPGGHAWLPGECAWLPGGHAWLLEGHAWLPGGHAWLPGGMHGCRGVPMWPIPSCIWCYLYAVSTPTESQQLCTCLYTGWSCDTHAPPVDRQTPVKT